jgi:pyruvate/2-oxoglutarate/acetoin dehydrogenase E1 component
LKYFDELKASMDMLAKDPRVVFIGQAVEYAGTAMSNTLKDVPKEKLIEMPVFEDTQMGITLGLALAGYIPVSIYPRWNFLICATNQLVNHVDKITMMSDYKPRIIIRTGIGSERPLHPQHQHVGDYTDAYKLMCPNIKIVRLKEPGQIYNAYCDAYLKNDGNATILVEYGDYYNEK